MRMTIDKSTEVLADYIDTYKICGGNGYNPATNITQEACEAFEMAIDIMCKYKKIVDIYYHQSGQALENSLMAVIEDGNNNN